MSFLINPSSLVLETDSVPSPRVQYQYAQDLWGPTSSLSNPSGEVLYDMQNMWNPLAGMRQPVVAQPSREQILSELLKQAAAEKAAEQRRVQRRKAIEAQIVALEMQRRREEEQRRARIAREGEIVAQQREYLRRVLAYTAYIEQQKRAAEENRWREQQRVREEPVMQQRAEHDVTASTPVRRYIRLGNYLLEVEPNSSLTNSQLSHSLGGNEQDNHLSSVSSVQNGDNQPALDSLYVNDIGPGLQARRATSINVPVSERQKKETVEDDKHPASTQNESVDMEKLINDACRALADAINMQPENADSDTKPYHKEDESHENLKEAEKHDSEPRSEARQCDSQADSTSTPEAQLLFSYDFPSPNTDYGTKIRQQAKADSIEVEITMDNGGSIRISGLWDKEAPSQTATPPRSPKSAHVSDVDENEEEIEVVENRPVKSDHIELKHSETIPLPEHPERIRAELTDEGFRLWLDSA
ncbi:hypothetical protein MYAM1_000434 [Malassezia yamatoensis]|uniref:Uncharacterized protein n=1 Tax=Malassezia yamatoensis TaxID=253288 RepID=A0AAJ5YR65_9BASI|nr:hypothetical protein MYAM1_000434 [Malassezia yamatoensis]